MYKLIVLLLLCSTSFAAKEPIPAWAIREYSDQLVYQTYQKDIDPWVHTINNEIMRAASVNNLEVFINVYESNATISQYLARVYTQAGYITSLTYPRLTPHNKWVKSQQGILLRIAW